MARLLAVTAVANGEGADGEAAAADGASGAGGVNKFDDSGVAVRIPYVPFDIESVGK